MEGENFLKGIKIKKHNENIGVRIKIQIKYGIHLKIDKNIDSPFLKDINPAIQQTIKIAE